ncbi:MAG: NADH:flavin oxidoreductase [Candidatus Abyssobacteria bacterium SURF_5]|uniref:NADH:flavin oxidoreductase n=1 Tax=Abyssobacteria bacterium (strain SURF_5) TaxID=2093360 RepID=A0A3A4N9C6_ABYX5|nr:MAG: NADH:flavin oxidoreductase [Candidatus Abyssubacteria bacterium SURF_5]
MYPHLFSPLTMGKLELKNRITMAPMYLGYAKDGLINDVLIEHYEMMAEGGVALVVVENATVDHPTGSGSFRTIRADDDEFIPGLTRLAQAIKGKGALACLQLNHAGRFAGATAEPVAPSAVETFGRMPRALSKDEMASIREKFVQAAVRVKKAGFDMVELHGGTGYLLAQFVSPHTNKRTDEYGSSPENRRRFPLEVLKAVKEAIKDFSVGYRFLADEWLPDGLKLEESGPFARALEQAGIAYISVMGGTYESFFLPEIAERSKKDGYMISLAAAIKKEVNVPVIAAGLITTGKLAEDTIAQGQADLIGLARVLWTDPEWPKKVRDGRESEIIRCDACDTCMHMLMQQKPPLCAHWPPAKRKEWKEKLRAIE